MDQVLLFGLASSPFAIVAACVSDKWCGILAVAFIVLPISVRVFSIFDPIIDSQQESTKSGKKGSLRYVVALVGLLGALGVGWGWFFLTFVPRELRSLLS